MDAKFFVAIGLAAAAWAGAHEYATRVDREDRDYRPFPVTVEHRQEHRGFDRDRYDRDADRREAWRREEWRREEWNRDRFEDRRHPASVLVVEDCPRPEPVRVVVSDPLPVRGTVSINW